MPKHAVTAGSGYPVLVFKNAPEGAVAKVEDTGQTLVLTAKDRKKPNMLAVQPGMHKVTVSLNGRTLYERDVFVQGETQKIIEIGNN